MGQRLSSGSWTDSCSKTNPGTRESGDGAKAPHKRFREVKTLPEGEFTSPEDFNSWGTLRSQRLRRAELHPRTVGNAEF